VKENVIFACGFFLKFKLSQLNSMLRRWKIAENILLTPPKHPTKVISAQIDLSQTRAGSTQKNEYKMNKILMG